MKVLEAIMILVAIILFSIAILYQGRGIDRLTNIAQRQSERIYNLEGVTFYLEGRLALLDPTMRDTSYLIPAKDSMRFLVVLPTDSLFEIPKVFRLKVCGIPVTYWETYVADLDTAIIADAVKDYWERSYWERR